MNTLRLSAIGVLILLISASCSLAANALNEVRDIPLPGNASRFDYQSFDAAANRLYFTHMGDGKIVVFDTAHRKVIAHLPGFPTATGILVVPKLHRVFVSVPGRRDVAIVDTDSLKTIARVPAGRFPDGLAYAPDEHKVFVSDESGGMETVIDTNTNQRVDSIDMGGEVGNTQYDAGSGHIMANVQTRNELVEIDPKTDKIIARHVLKGGQGPHGLLILPDQRLAFAACELDAKLLVVDLKTFTVKQVLTTGDGPDVLAYDPGLHRLYVATETDVVSIFHLHDATLTKEQDLTIAPRAHTISVNPANHEVYLPLEDVNDRPVLRIMAPVTP